MARWRGSDGKIYNFKTGDGAVRLPDEPQSKPSTNSRVPPGTITNQFEYNRGLTAQQRVVTRSTASNTKQLIYPLENRDYYKAAIKFEVHKVNQYDVDFTTAREILDTPWLSRTTSAIANKLSQSRDTESTAANEDANADKAAAKKEEERKQKEIEKQISDASKETATKLKGGTNRDLGMTTQTTGTSIKLYFPVGVPIQDNVQYDNQNLGFMGAAALGAVNNGQSLMGAMMGGVREGIVDIFNLIRGNFDNAMAAQAAAARGVQRMPDNGVKTAASIALQATVNPNTRTLFQGVNIRQFTFTFKFLPKSAAEAATVRDIIKTFRTELYPESIAPGGIPLGYRFPNMFQISFMYNDGVNQNLAQPLLCYLRDVNTTINPQSMSWHEDGAPVEQDMTVTFQEFRALTRQDVEKGSDGNIIYGGTH